MGWVTLPNGRRYLNKPLGRMEAGYGLSSPVDERVRLPQSERAYSEQRLPGGFTVTTWEDPPLSDALRRSESQEPDPVDEFAPSAPVVGGRADSAWEPLLGDGSP